MQLIKHASPVSRHAAAMKWLTMLIPPVPLPVCTPLKTKSTHLNREPVHWFPPNTLQVCYHAVFLTPSTSSLLSSILSLLSAICFQLWILWIWGRWGIFLIYCELKSSLVRCICSRSPPAAELKGQTYTAVDLSQTHVQRGHTRPDWQEAEMTAGRPRPQGEKSWRAMRS